MVTIDFHRDSLPVVCVDDYFGDGTPDRYEDEYTYTGDRVRLDSSHLRVETQPRLDHNSSCKHGLRIVRLMSMTGSIEAVCVDGGVVGGALDVSSRAARLPLSLQS